MRFKGTKHWAEQRGVCAHLLDEAVLAANHRSSRSITMTADIFCDAVDYHIKAMSEWLHQVRSSEGVVDDAGCTYLSGSSADGVQVCDFHQRVRDSLYKDYIRLFLADDLARVSTAEVFKNDLYPQRHKDCT